MLIRIKRLSKTFFYNIDFTVEFPVLYPENKLNPENDKKRQKKGEKEEEEKEERKEKGQEEVTNYTEYRELKRLRLILFLKTNITLSNEDTGTII